MSYIAQYQLRTQRTIDLSEDRQFVAGTTFAENYDLILQDGVNILPGYGYNTWCVDSLIPLANSRTRVFNVYSTTELANGSVNGALPSYIGDRAGTEQYFDSVTWLINQNLIGKDASDVLGAGYSGIITAREIQAAIWTTLEQDISGVLGVPNVDYSLVNAQALAALALSEGDGFEADSTQLQGVVLVDSNTTFVRQPQITFVQAAQLGNFVWFDANQNGIQDEDEVGIQGVTVKLLRDINGDGTISTDEIVAITTTDATGYYDFKGLVGGVRYQVLFDMRNSTDLAVTIGGEVFTVADGNSFFLSPALQGDNTEIDSNAQQFLDPNTFATYYLSDVVTLTAGEFDQTIDAGFWAAGVGTPPTAGLGNYVWNDANRNGIQDAGEVGISGATVNVLQNGEVIATTTTDSTGYYEFLDLAAGVEYQVSFDVSGIANGRAFALTAANQGNDNTLDSDATIINGVAITQPIVLAGGDFNQTIDAGFYDSSAGLTAPGTGTPGFWHQRGRSFWDGDITKENGAGKKGFAKGELLTPGATGVLIGDFNRNGVTDNGENTIFFNFNEADTLIDSSNHGNTSLLGGAKGALMLGRATVASWLNYLAGNSVDLASGTKGIADYLDNSVTWLNTYQSGGINATALSSDPLGLGVTGNQLATILDNYNNGSATFATGNFSRG